MINLLGLHFRSDFSCFVGQFMYQNLDMIFKFPSMHFPSMHFPKFPKLSAKDFAGGKATMSSTEFHCVNGVCDGKARF